MASRELINIIIKAVDEASATAKKVDNNLKKIGNSASKLSKIPGFDAMKTKLSGVASTLDTKLGGAITKARAKFNTLKTSVTNVATGIKTKMGAALDGVRAKLSTMSNGAKGLASSMNFLKGAVSMTAGMIGFELVSGIIEAGRAAINASSQLDYFGGRLQNASGKTKMSAAQFKQLKGQLGDLQKEFRKVDMTAVGATAEEIALKMNLPANKIGDLTRMTAVLSSTFVKEGRTQEDAVLAVGDALDGQFKRLQEIGITQDKLKENGWNGNLEDQAGLIDALNKTMKEMGYEQTAKDITNLDEAFTALSIAGGQLMQAVLVPLTPVLIQIIGAAIQATDAVKPFIQTLQGAVNALPDWLKDAAWAGALVVAIYLIGTAVTTSLIPALAAATLAMIDFTIAMLANPLTWVVIALVAVAYAVYEVGKAFGWWNDVGSMLDAITAGLQRLWSAFINNPDVQLFIQGIIDGFTWLIDIVGQVGQAVMEFFGISSEGNFDIVRTLIDGIGAAWNAVRPAIMFVIDVWHQLASAIELFRTGQMDLPTFIMNILTILANAYRTIFTTIIGLVVRFASQLVQRGISAAKNFVNGIILRLRLLPSLAYQALLLVVSRIVSAGAKWVSTAKSKASSLVSSVYNTLSGLPGKIASALSGLASAIAKPFQDAYNRVAQKVEQIKSKAQEIPVVGGLFAGYDYLEGQNADGSWINAAGYELGNNTQTLNGEFTFIHDLRNVPPGVSPEEVASIVEKSTTNDEFIKKLVSNTTFQNYDLKVKSSIAAKTNRARGV